MLFEKKKKDTFVAENAGNPLGEMLEWLKRHAWKACIRQKAYPGFESPSLREMKREMRSKYNK